MGMTPQHFHTIPSKRSKDTRTRLLTTYTLFVASRDWPSYTPRVYLEKVAFLKLLVIYLEERGCQMTLVVTATCAVYVGRGLVRHLTRMGLIMYYSVAKYQVPHPNPYSNKSLPCWPLTIVLQLQDTSFVATLRWPLNHGYWCNWAMHVCLTKCGVFYTYPPHCLLLRNVGLG